MRAFPENEEWVFLVSRISLSVVLLHLFHPSRDFCFSILKCGPVSYLGKFLWIEQLSQLSSNSKVSFCLKLLRQFSSQGSRSLLQGYFIVCLFSVFVLRKKEKVKKNQESLSTIFYTSIPLNYLFCFLTCNLQKLSWKQFKYFLNSIFLV